MLGWDVQHKRTPSPLKKRKKGKGSKQRASRFGFKEAPAVITPPQTALKALSFVPRSPQRASLVIPDNASTQSHPLPMATLTFRRIVPLKTSPQPLPRQGHASAFHKGSLFVFGGRVQGSGRIYSNDLWKYNPDQNTWEEVMAQDPSLKPCKRHNHSCVVGTDALYVFGGQTVSNAYLGDLWRFDLQTLQWTELTPSHPRHSHAACKHGKSMVIFGGRTGLEPAVYSNEVLTYDFDSNTWTTLYPGDDQSSAAAVMAPHPRSYTSVVQCGQCLVVFGGYYWDGKEHYFSDTFGFSLKSRKWVKLSPLGDERVPHPRNRNGVLSLPVTDGRSESGMMTFGGNYYNNQRGTDRFFDDAWWFGSGPGGPLTSGKWSKVILIGDIPCARGHPSWVADDQVAGRSWMFGGEANRDRFNDLYEVKAVAPRTQSAVGNVET